MAKDFDTMEDSNRSANPSIHAAVATRRGARCCGCRSARPRPRCSGRCWRLRAGGRCAAAAARRGRRSASRPCRPRRATASWCPRATWPQVIAPWGEPVGVRRRDAGLAARRAATAPPTRRCRWACTTTACTTSRSTAAAPRPAGDEPRVHRRRPAAPRRHGDLDGREGAQGAGRARRVGDRGRAAAAARWQMVRPSRYARRFTASTPFAVGGPAAGHALMRTAADPAGRTVLGTLNNCASGMTPWGTYLSGEENWAGYFDGGDSPTPDQRRWGMRKASWYRWAEHRRALRRRAAPQRVPTASAGWSRSTRWTRPARRSSAPRSAAPRTRAPGSR